MYYMCYCFIFVFLINDIRMKAFTVATKSKSYNTMMTTLLVRNTTLTVDEMSNALLYTKKY